MIKRIAWLFAALLLGGAVACQQQEPETAPVKDGAVEGINPFDATKADAYYGYAEITVPCGTEVVYVQYKGSAMAVPVPVEPIVARPEGGKDVEPFGRVKLLFQSETPTVVEYVYLDPPTKADTDETYLLKDFPVEKVAFGEFGKTRYVQVAWSFAWENSEQTGWQNTPTYPKDVLVYDAAHNHTLLYKFAYAGGVAGEGYFLDEAYTIEDHTVTGYKYHYGACGNSCPYCMPWGCSCGCGNDNPDFVASGDTTAELSAGSTSQVAQAPAGVNTVNLMEPASYSVGDQGYTFYHSNGTVMFDDSFPELPFNGGTASVADYNDVVVDYDVEAKTVSDALLEEEGWREQVKVVLHVRALGSTKAWRVGMILEDFDMDYVESVEEHKTLDSYNNPHGELPSWTVRTLQENSLHYDPFAIQYRTQTNKRASIEIGGLQRLNGTGSSSRAGSEVYTYVNDKVSVEHVFNPGLKQYAAWGGPHEEQYGETMKSLSGYINLSRIQGYGFYNAIPGYVNVSGGLYTYTVIYNMKNRADMTPEQRQKALTNMLQAVVRTTSQNFFVINQSYVPTHLKGYQPLDYKTKDGRNYGQIYQNTISGNANLSTSTSFVSVDGQVWGFKCPPLTRHLWEKQSFDLAYPHYRTWVESDGAQHSNWYREDVNAEYLSCWW